MLWVDKKSEIFLLWFINKQIYYIINWSVKGVKLRNVVVKEF